MKSYKSADLHDVLSRWCHIDTNVLPNSEAGQVESVRDTLMSIDIEIFENTQKLLGDSFPEIVASIFRDIDNTLEKLSNWTDPLDIDRFALLPHSMKSSSAYIGATKLNQLAVECESDAREGNIKKALSYLNEMKVGYENVVKDLAKLGYIKSS